MTKLQTSIVVVIFAIGFLLGISVLYKRFDTARGKHIGLARNHALSAPAGSMTVYAVTNPNIAALDLKHTFTDGFGFEYIMWTLLPAGTMREFHLRDLPQIPSPFQGYVNLEAPETFIAKVTGYDQLVDTPTPEFTVTPVSTPTPTMTPTVTPTMTPAVTPTPSLLPYMLHVHWACRQRTNGTLRDTKVEADQPAPGCGSLFEQVRIVVGH
jgi:hypothetical protein